MPPTRWSLAVPSPPPSPPPSPAHDNRALIVLALNFASRQLRSMLPSVRPERTALSFFPASLFKRPPAGGLMRPFRRRRRRRRNKTFSCTSVNLIFHYRRRDTTDVVTATICCCVQEHKPIHSLATRIWEKRDEILPRRHEKLPKHGTLGGISKDSISPASWIFPCDVLTVIGHLDKTFNSVLTQFPSLLASSLINIIRRRGKIERPGRDANDLSSALPYFANRIGINPWTLEWSRRLY